MTAFPFPRISEAEDFQLIPPMDYSISEGNRVLPAPLQLGGDVVQ